jgi:hypothetical protein
VKRDRYYCHFIHVCHVVDLMIMNRVDLRSTFFSRFFAQPIYDTYAAVGKDCFFFMLPARFYLLVACVGPLLVPYTRVLMVG